VSVTAVAMTVRYRRLHRPIVISAA
jgi:hypothetical protein